MRIWYHNIGAPSRACARLDADVVRVGRQGDNDVVLASPLVAEHALRISRIGSRWELEALGFSGCEVAGTRIRLGERVALFGGCRVDVFPYTLDIELESDANGVGATLVELSAAMASAVQQLHQSLLKSVSLEQTDQAMREGADSMIRLEHAIDDLAEELGLLGGSADALLGFLAGSAVKNNLIDRYKDLDGAGDSRHQQTNPGGTGRSWSDMTSQVPQYEAELRRMVAEARTELGADELTTEKQFAAIDACYWPWWFESLDSRYLESLRYLAKRELKRQIKDLVFGYGPLEDLLRQPDITEIMVVRRDRIYVEKNGKLEDSGRQFVSDEVTTSIIERIVGRVGRRIDRSQPIVDARLPDGSRVHAALPPVAIDGPSLTIRKFPRRWRMTDLIRHGALSDPAASFLRAATLDRRNILVSGSTGSGKTTFLNCLADWFPASERIVTIEDTAELRLDHPHVVRLETKTSNAEGAGALFVRDLIRTSLRMRPDRLVVGECRGPEALDMLQAMNTGHDGSLTTLHANSPEDVGSRLETLVQMASPLPVETIHRQIASALDLIVHVERRGSRRVVSRICEVVGIDARTRCIELRNLFALDGDALLDGTLQPSGSLPTFLAQLLEKRLYSMHGFYRTPPAREVAPC